MRMTKLFGQTLRETPADTEVVSHQLLLRAGFISQLGAGIFSYLPLAKRSLTKIENIIREEMNAIGGQEIEMPVVHPAEFWKESRRWYQIGSEMARFQDRVGRDMVLAMTHEEVITDLVRKEIRSYRQLPALVYHLQTKWRDDPRPRAGLIRVREFTMKDSYSLDVDREGLDTQYRAHYQAYFNIFNRCAVSSVAVGSDVGMMGGSMAHEFMYLTPIGEDTIIFCDSCHYAANRQIARVAKLPATAEEPKPVRKIPTPHVATIEELSKFLGVPKARTAKAVFMVGSFAEGTAVAERLVFAVVRGDMDVNETKLGNATRAMELRPARDEEIRAVGAVPGYASPIGLKDVLVAVDDSIVNSPNLVAGANEEGYHLENVNYGRDFVANVVADLALAREGDSCPDCGGSLRASRGVEIGNIFKLGTRYSDSMGAYFLDRDGKSKPVVMGSYGIGVGRLLACVAEEHHDDRGLVWPISVAPYQVHVVSLLGGNDDVAEKSALLYDELQSNGIEVLLDDRDESPGVKFADADLIGIPLRLTVSRRSLAGGGIELKRRDQPETTVVPAGKVVEAVRGEVASMRQDIAARVVHVPFKE